MVIFKNFLSIEGETVSSDGSNSSEWSGWFHSVREAISAIKKRYYVKSVKPKFTFQIKQYEVYAIKNIK